MISDMIVAIIEAKKAMEEHTNKTVYIVGQFKELDKTMVYSVENCRIIGFSSSAGQVIIFIEYKIGDINAMPLKEFEDNTYESREAAEQEKSRRETEW